MALLTIPQKIDIGKLSVAYAIVDILKSGYVGGGVDLDLPRKIYCVTKNCNWLYSLSPSDSSLTATASYLIQLCGKYYLQANAAISSGGTPVTPGIVQIVPSPIMITGSLFSSALSWTGTNNDSLTILPSYTLQVFWNGLNRFLVKDYEWSRTLTGFDIIINGVTITDFNGLTTNATDIFYIFISV